MSRPKLLDLFCGAGGAGMGYYRAGFDVTGVDIRPQPHYPFTFHQADALAFVAEHWEAFDAIHASPPCQAFTQMSARYRGKGGRADSHPDLLTPTCTFLRSIDRPYVIENVPGAGRMMRTTIVLHGGMFGLGVHRPRHFETDPLIFTFYAPRCPLPIGVYGERPDGRRTHWRNNGNGKGKSIVRAAKSIEQAREAMGIDWMDWPEIKEAIPPAYTEFIGRQLIAAIDTRSVA